MTIKNDAQLQAMMRGGSWIYLLRFCSFDDLTSALLKSNLSFSRRRIRTPA